jgi:hypothetical protein
MVDLLLPAACPPDASPPPRHIPGVLPAILSTKLLEKIGETNSPLTRPPSEQDALLRYRFPPPPFCSPLRPVSSPRSGVQGGPGTALWEETRCRSEVDSSSREETDRGGHGHHEILRSSVGVVSFHRVPLHGGHCRRVCPGPPPSPPPPSPFLMLCRTWPDKTI